jgi:hypothetical protein
MPCQVSRSPVSRSNLIDVSSGADLTGFRFLMKKSEVITNVMFLVSGRHTVFWGVLRQGRGVHMHNMSVEGQLH